MRYGYNTMNPHPDYKKLKPLIGKAFKQLRQLGIIARQNFMCCNSCAGNDIGNYIEKLSDNKRKKIRGMVYFCRQGETSFKETGDLYLQYCDRSTNARPDDVDLSTKEVGKLICSVFKKLNIPYNWNGDDNKCIHVVTPKNLKNNC